MHILSNRPVAGDGERCVCAGMKLFVFVVRVSGWSGRWEVCSERSSSLSRCNFHLKVKRSIKERYFVRRHVHTLEVWLHTSAVDTLVRTVGHLRPSGSVYSAVWWAAHSNSFLILVSKFITVSRTTTLTNRRRCAVAVVKSNWTLVTFPTVVFGFIVQHWYHTVCAIQGTVTNGH